MNNTSSKPYCFIDFDGTIVDNKKRMYQFCCDYCCEEFQSIFSIDEYWTLKRFGINELAVINAILKTDIDNDEYVRTKLSHIEDERYLAQDELIPGSREALAMLDDYYNLVLVSRREHPDRLISEINRFFIADYFSDIIVIPHNHVSKAEAIREQFLVSSNSVLIGDTEDDFLSGIDLGIRTGFVLSGIRSSAYLMPYLEKELIDIYDALIDFAQSVALQLDESI